MSDMFSQFDTDESMEVTGINLDYGTFRVRIARAGGSNKKYLSFAEKKTKPLRRAIQVGALDEKRSREILYEIYAHTIILDWEIADGENEDKSVKWKRGIHKKGGGHLEFTEENVVSTFKLLPGLFQDIQSQAESLTNFKKEELEADSKN